MRIVWNSFHGRYSDSPRALYERVAGDAGLEHVWLVDHRHAGAFPTGVDLVDVDGPEAAVVLGCADLVVASSHTEVEWEKSTGTRYVQTWHGTPLKRIHYDVLWAPPGRLERLDRDVAMWDLLLSPNPVATLGCAARSATRVSCWSPAIPATTCSAARVRPRRGPGWDRWGFAETTMVVLYAPTWRDDEVFGDTAEVSEVPLLDLAGVVPGLGSTAVLLVRAHNLATARARVAVAPGVVDVSGHADMADLLAVADVLVTDYSSSMFDFAITGRPMLHLAYDLDRFRDSVRGFYTDLEDAAAGPVVTTPDDLEPWLADLSWARESPWTKRYHDFRSTYAVLEDGHATDRVLGRLGLLAGS